MKKWGMMNKNILQAYRDSILEGLTALTDGNRKLFVRIFSHSDRDKEIIDIVEGLNEDDLNKALALIDRTLERRGLL